MDKGKLTKEYIVVCQSAWMNDTGWGIAYNWDRERFAKRAAAIKHGWKLRDSDDFNIAEVCGDRLVWFGWMDEQIEEDDAAMREIADGIGLTYEPVINDAGRLAPKGAPL